MRISELVLVATIAALLVVVATVPASAMERGTAIALGFGTFGLALISASLLGLVFKAAETIARLRAVRRERQMTRAVSSVPSGAAY